MVLIKVLISLVKNFQKYTCRSGYKVVMSSLLALFVYIVPNLIQDFHRVFGHHEHYSDSRVESGIHSSHSENCQVCKFEFNILDELESFFILTALPAFSVQFIERHDNQLYPLVFHYYNLRAPPQFFKVRNIFS